MNEPQENPYAAPIVQKKEVETRRQRVRRIVLRLLGVTVILDCVWDLFRVERCAIRRRLACCACLCGHCLFRRLFAW
jgi:hypothetical protein